MSPVGGREDLCILLSSQRVAISFPGHAFSLTIYSSFSNFLYLMIGIECEANYSFNIF